MSTIPNRLPIFQAVPFKPDGGVPLGGLLMTVAFSFGAAVLIGGIVSVIHQWFYLMLLFPLGMGLGVGFAGAAGISLGKVRSPWIGGLLASSAGLLVMLASYYGGYLIFLDKVNAQVPGMQAQDEGLSFVKFMDMLAEQGVTIGRMGQGKGKGMNLGYYGSYIYWCAEIGFAVWITCSMMIGPTREPFCLNCQTWKPGQVLGGLTLPREAAREIMNDGDLPKLQEFVPRPDTPVALGNPIVFTGHVCTQCGEHGTVEINLKDVATNAKGEQKVTELGTWSFAGESLPAWQSVLTSA